MQAIQKIIIRNSSKGILTDEERKDIISPEEYKIKKRKQKKQNIVSAFEKREWKITCQS